LFWKRRFTWATYDSEEPSGGYDPKYHHLFDRAVEELRAEGLVMIFAARTGQGSDLHIVAVFDKLSQVRGLMNAYRKSVGLRPLRRDLQEFT